MQDIHRYLGIGRANLHHERDLFGIELEVVVVKCHVHVEIREVWAELPGVEGDGHHMGLNRADCIESPGGNRGAYGARDKYLAVRSASHATIREGEQHVLGAPDGKVVHPVELIVHLRELALDLDGADLSNRKREAPPVTLSQRPLKGNGNLIRAIGCAGKHFEKEHGRLRRRH